MADDIDDLLNEVESKYCAGSRGKQNVKPAKTATTTSNLTNVHGSHSGNRSKCKDNDLNSMLEDIFDDGDPLTEVPVSPKTSNSTSGVSAHGSSMQASGGTKKCFPVYLGGTSCAQGLATTVKQRVCDQLRCTDCDFRVSAFDNFSWHSTVDYLFLRNHMPDFDRLAPKLIPKKGSRAYACQCKWKTVRDLTDLQAEGDLNLKWVCGKH